jgi:hypothetical protein
VAEIPAGYIRGRYDDHDRTPVSLVHVELDGGGIGLAAVEMDESGQPQVALLTKAPEPTRPTVRRVDESIALTAAETERSFRLWRKHLNAKRRPDARIRRATGEIFRSQRWFNLLRHRPAAGRVKARARAAPRRSSRTAAARSRDRPREPDDDDLEGRRCPRCGGVSQPVPGSGLWTCDECLAASWERMVEHELGRVIAEAEAITREAAAS